MQRYNIKIKNKGKIHRQIPTSLPTNTDIVLLYALHGMVFFRCFERVHYVKCASAQKINTKT